MDVRNKLIPKVIMLIVIGVVTLIIFFNSLGDVVASHQASGMVTDIILPGHDAEKDYLELIVRKMAHLIEYAVLGIAVMLFVKCVEKDYLKRLYGTALFYVLFVAVLDEYIQGFSGRTSSTGDILLDFLGALVGFAFVFAILFVRKRLKNRNRYKVSAETASEVEQKEAGR